MGKKVYEIPRTATGTPMFYEALPDDAVRGRLFYRITTPDTQNPYLYSGFRIYVWGQHLRLTEGAPLNVSGIEADNIASVDYPADPQDSTPLPIAGSIELPDLLYPRVLVDADVHQPGSGPYYTYTFRLWLAYED